MIKVVKGTDKETVSCGSAFGRFVVWTSPVADKDGHSEFLVVERWLVILVANLAIASVWLLLALVTPMTRLTLLTLGTTIGQIVAPVLVWVLVVLITIPTLGLVRAIEKAKRQLRSKYALSGYGIAHCVSAAVHNGIQPEGIAEIFSDTVCWTHMDWDAVIKRYLLTDWHGCEHGLKCSDYLWKLIAQGKINQPWKRGEFVWQPQTDTRHCKWMIVSIGQEVVMDLPEGAVISQDLFSPILAKFRTRVATVLCYNCVSERRILAQAIVEQALEPLLEWMQEEIDLTYKQYGITRRTSWLTSRMEIVRAAIEEFQLVGKSDRSPTIAGVLLQSFSDDVVGVVSTQDNAVARLKRGLTSLPQYDQATPTAVYHEPIAGEQLYHALVTLAAGPDMLGWLQSRQTPTRTS